MKRRMTFLILAVLMVVSLVVAQPKRNLSENEVRNLLTAIESENVGLKKSAMYFAGYYKIDAAVEALQNELNKSSDPSVQILAALALFEVGDETVLNDLQNLAGNPKENMKVRKMAKAIYDHWVSTDYNFISTVQ